jgi:hypothetical protein
MIKKIIKTIWKISYYSNSKTNLVNLYVGFKNNDFYMVKNCKSKLNIDSVSYCKTNSFSYLAYIRNSKVFGGSLLRNIYGIDSSGNLDSTKIATESSNYNATERAWYKIRNGYTDVQSFASGGSGRSFCSSLQSIDIVGTVAGVVAGDYDANEPCGTANSKSFILQINFILFICLILIFNF